tara:strand:+ start:373 stop:528 length:156 start_codon:yes stop_codon:yes gene_type:complete
MNAPLPFCGVEPYRHPMQIAYLAGAPTSLSFIFNILFLFLGDKTVKKRENS